MKNREGYTDNTTEHVIRNASRIPHHINEVYKAAMAGSPVAQFQMGNFFLDGLNVRKSDRHAMEWWEKAALQGYAPAQYYLGQMYFVGEGIKHDFVKGCSWIGSAARQGLRDAAAMYAARCAEP